MVGATVVLLQGGVVVAETTTDDNGAYTFTGLVAGDYQVRFEEDQGEVRVWREGSRVILEPLDELEQRVLALSHADEVEVTVGGDLVGRGDAGIGLAQVHRAEAAQVGEAGVHFGGEAAGRDR